MSLVSETQPADLALRVDALARSLVDTLSAALGETIDAGPADDQQAVDELIPPDGGWATAAEVHGDSSVVAVLLAPDVAERLDAATGSWTGVVDAVLEAWARSEGGVVAPAMPPVPAASAGALLPMAPGLRLSASGCFVGDRHVGTVAVLARPRMESARELPETARRPDPGPLQALAEVEMAVTAELGRCRMPVAELLNLVPGAVVELDRTAGTPIDLLVNGTLIARGEVVVVDEEYGVRITEIVGTVED